MTGAIISINSWNRANIAFQMIPSKIRKKLNIGSGSLLAVTAQDDLIILKKVSSNISSKDMMTLKLIEEAWEDIDKGKYKVRSKNEFFKEFREW